MVDEQSFTHLFNLGYDVDKIIADNKFNLQELYRQWFLESLIND